MANVQSAMQLKKTKMRSGEVPLLLRHRCVASLRGWYFDAHGSEIAHCVSRVIAKGTGKVAISLKDRVVAGFTFDFVCRFVVNLSKSLINKSHNLREERRRINSLNIPAN